MDEAGWERTIYTDELLLGYLLRTEWFFIPDERKELVIYLHKVIQ